ncbi:MAG: TerC family protein [Deltaproteobacteria bacterium]|nr:TerC family protein [Deltaproteobacteria bacterium]
MEILSIDMLSAFLSLTAIEIVLGIDNIVFTAVTAQRLQEPYRTRARQLGIGLAMFLRIGLLLIISWLIQLTAPLFSVLGKEISGRDLILLLGGLFLLAKATMEIHHNVEAHEAHKAPVHEKGTFLSVIIQIVLLDIVFSLDSVITAIGMAQQISIMIAAIVVAVTVMLFFAGTISKFIENHPTLKILALSFLLLVGVLLLAEGFGKHLDRNYVYFAMAFSLGIEVLNIRMRHKAELSKKIEKQPSELSPNIGKAQ